jgi:hypothetical protein
MRNRFLSATIGRAVTGCMTIATAVEGQTGTSPANRIRVGENVHVSVARATASHGEFWVCSDRSNPMRLMVGAMSHVQPATPHRQPGETEVWVNQIRNVYYATHDGGKSWRLSLEAPGADPVCEYGENGAVLASATHHAYLQTGRPPLGDIWQLRPGIVGLDVWRSGDGGATWDKKPAVLWPTMDRPTILTDLTGGQFHGRVYYVGKMQDSAQRRHRYNRVGLYRSLDKGQTFQLAALTASSADSTFFVPGTGGILSDGTVIFPVAGVIGPFVRGAAVSWYVLRSSDGGETFERPVRIVGLGAISWRTMAVDPGSQWFKDRVYFAWSDTVGGRRRVLLSQSADGGRTWSPRRFVDDGVEAMPNQSGDPHPVVQVNRNGIVGVQWYHRVDVNGHPGWELRVSASVDGGETFMRSVRVSSKPSPKVATEGVHIDANGWSGMVMGESTGLHLGFFDAAHGISTVGDTDGMGVTADGVFHPVWADTRTGVAQVWTSTVAVDGVAAPNGAPALARYVDVSSQLMLTFRRVYFDRRAGLLTMELKLTNVSSKPIRGPVKLRLLELNAPSGNWATGTSVASARVEGAENGIDGPGAVWDLSALIPAGGFAPNAESKVFPFTIRIRPTACCNPSLRFSVLAPAQ